MRFLKVTSEYGVIVRKQAMVAKCVSRDDVLRVFNNQPPLDEDDHILSMGPSFGEGAANTLVESIEALGLRYVDDFFLLATDVPAWCQLGMALI